ncbi:PTS sugar transporter subunit IIA [uncultured Kocuria sp.]|uniref:PTS sugar transporter subunit IIA n=1 Tax=uncultured Kocuria sp. TaxID=259305 RepID=UPI002610A3C7|nr:PTS sugar transporter subunit IIA [uncultured Kocuria sp.]
MSDRTPRTTHDSPGRSGSVLEHLSESTVLLDVHGADRDGVIRQLAELGAHTGRAYDADETVAAALAREEEGSTGVGNGVALPHAESAGAERPMVAFARSTDGVEWNSLDGEPVHLVFLISLPGDRSGGEHLELLAELSEALAEESCRQALLDAGSASEVLAVLRDAMG